MAQSKPTVSKQTKTHAFQDLQSGLVVSTKEYPSNWEVISKAVYKNGYFVPGFAYQMQGPGNVQAFNNAFGDVYTIYGNPQTNQYMRQVGERIRPVGNIDMILEHGFAPRMTEKGYRFSRSRSSNSLEQLIRQKFAHYGITNFDMDIRSTEWVNGKGQTGLMNLVLYRFYSRDMYGDLVTSWTYSVDFVFADTPLLDDAYAAILNGSRSERDNPQWLQYKNRKTRELQQASMQNHRAQMLAQRRAFEANNRIVANRNASSDRGQASFINFLRDEQTVSSSDGATYQVEGYAREYWMDGQGNYIKSNDLFYNPNGDLNLNHKEWNKASVKY